MSSEHLDENFLRKQSDVEIDLSWIIGKTCSAIFLQLSLSQRFFLWKFYHARDRIEYQSLLKELVKQRKVMQAKLVEGDFSLPFRLASCSL